VAGLDPQMAAATTAAGVRRWRLYAPGPYGQVHARAAAPALGDGGKRPLVCFHTSPLSGAEFEMFMGEMAKDRLVLAPDTPGFGASERPLRPQSIGQYAAALADAVEASGLIEKGRPFDILGTHTGAAFAAELASTRPRSINRAVLAGAPLFSDEARTAMLALYGHPNPIFSDPDYVPRTFSAQVLADSPLSHERRFELFLDSMRSGTQSWWAPQAVMSYRLDEALRQIRLPTLFLVTKDVLAANTREAAALTPGSTVADLEGETDSAYWDLQAALIARTVRAFLDT